MNECAYYDAETTVRLAIGTITHLPPDITASEEEFLNSLPTHIIYPVLMDLLIAKGEANVRSRAFDALMKLTDLDTVGFLIELFRKSTDWGIACCKYMANLQDDRVIEHLSEVAKNHDDGDFRYVAVVALGNVGNNSIIPLLKSIALTDLGADYEGFPIKDAALDAISAISNR